MEFTTSDTHNLARNVINDTDDYSQTFLREECQANTLPSTFLAVTEAFITSLGLIFNGIAMFVIIQLKDYKKVVSHWYVLHLSIADVMLLLHLPFKTSQHLHGYWMFPSWFCTYSQGIFMTSYYAGILFLTVMSFDRYVAIVHPVSAKWRKIRTRYNANIVTLVVWTLSFLFSVPLWVFSKATKCTCGYAFKTENEENYDSQEMQSGSYNETVEGINFEGYEDIIYDENYLIRLAEEHNGGYAVTRECVHIDSRTLHIWIICNFIVTFVVPIIIMGICYSLILWRVLHPAISATHANSHRRRKLSESSTRKDSHGKTSFRLSSSSSTSSSHRFSRKGKVTFVVASLVACFLLCWFPFHVVHLTRIGGLPIRQAQTYLCEALNNISHVLAYSNSMLNPILYTFLGSDFRRRLKAATKSFRPRRTSFSGFSKGQRTARTSVPTYGRSLGTGYGTQRKAMEGPSSYPMNTIHSIVSKNYSQDLNDKSQFSSRRTDCSSRCEMDALQYSDMSESRLIH